ncbi:MULTISPECIES: ANTAR domain-containing protein [unclassified Streptomyces]|uniref:ANTAR domain-containing protein n=1 Tax=unclassified Streptomyces TaxID=2593676 RepID=UPI00343F7DB6
MSQLPTQGPGEQLGVRTENEQMPQAAQPQRDGVRQVVVEHATGVVMALGRCDAVQAETVLSEVSHRTGITMGRVAELLTDWVTTGELNLGLRMALEEAIRDHRHHVHPVPAPVDETKIRDGEDHAVPQA